MSTPFDLPPIDGVRDDMCAVTDDIRSLLADLDQQARGGLREWPSDAREAYEAGKLKWDAAAAKMSEALGRAEQADFTAGDSAMESAIESL